jgi:hypothetical protein
MIDATEDPETKHAPALELVLAQQANDAIAKGADPAKASEMLRTMLTHIRANPDLAQQGAAALHQGADPGQVAHKVWELANAPKPEQPGVLSRAGTQINEALGQIVHHPIDTAVGMAKSAGQSLYDTFAAGVKGEELHSDLAMLHNRGVVKPDEGVTPKRFVQASAQTVANAAFPSVAGGVAGRLGGGALAKAAGLATAGGAAGAANSPDDPGAGLIAGAVLAPVLDAGARGLVKGAGKVGGGLADVGEKVMDVKGRPDTPRPVVTIAGKPFGRIASVSERAAQLNEQRVGHVDVPNSGKPLTPADASVAAQRLARGLKTSSPGAESVLADALHGRAEGAVDRVIQHGLETSGLQTRESGLQLVDDLIAKRAEEAKKTFDPIYANYPNPIDDPRFDDILKTDAGQQVLGRFKKLVSNKRLKIGTVTEIPDAPPGIKPEDWANTIRLAKERGIDVPQLAGTTRLAPTLQQAHYMKMAFDDLLNSPPEPGSGGLGPHNAKAIRDLKHEWLDVMHDHGPELSDALKQYADHSDLVRAAELGRTLFKLHPDEAAKAFRDMSQAERDVARRSGFDALSERVENGPVDVEKGVAKPRDQKRMRLLFPDDASFAQFQEGLKQEAQMHATKQGVLGGSNTADKLSDMAGMAGITLPDVLAASQGRVMPVLKKVGASALRKTTSAAGDRLKTEQARQLVAGADGDRSALIRLEALRRAGRTP